jgi:hypothetical protein
MDVAVDGNRAYAIGSQGPFRDRFTNVNDIGPTGNLVVAVLDISDPRNPQIIGTPTVLPRAARGLGEVVAVAGHRIAFSTLGSLTDQRT